MKTLLRLGLFCLLCLLAACNSAPKAADPQPADSSANMKTEQAPHSDEENPAGKLSLNNGAKWKVNPETKEGIEKMKALLNAEKDAKKLANGLNGEFDTLLKKCTMKGAAHEALHQFLLPLKGKIENLSKAGDESARKDIETYLNVFGEYFE